MINPIEPLRVELGLENAARDLAELLARPDNKDIEDEFPASVRRYKGDIATVRQHLEESAEDCEPGSRQRFVAYSGETAVGLSVVRFADSVPEGIDPEWPNFSGFICNPYHRQGLGRLSAQNAVECVNQQFGGKAWTQVKHDNAPSKRMVKGAGFVPIYKTDTHTIYTYSNSSRS